MSRLFLIAFLAAVFLCATAPVPTAFGPVLAPDISGFAHAATNLNSSKSNIYRQTTSGRKQKRLTTQKPSKQPSSAGGRTKCPNVLNKCCIWGTYVC